MGKHRRFLDSPPWTWPLPKRETDISVWVKIILGQTRTVPLFCLKQIVLLTTSVLSCKRAEFCLGYRACQSIGIYIAPIPNCKRTSNWWC